MRMIFTAPSVVPCDVLKGVLDSNGIGSVIRNERGSAGAGTGDPVPFMPSLTFAWPEVWVADADAEAAAALAAGMNTDERPVPAPWTCRRCGETVDLELETCWNCETPKEE